MILTPMILAVGACDGSSDQSTLGSVDINAAADAAQGSIDTYAADALEAAPTPLPPAPVVRSPELGIDNGADNAVTATDDATAAIDAAAAGDVVRRYYAAIGEARYGDARALWERDGAASGMAPDAFAAGFAGFSDYRAVVGAPGRIDAGAGQRFVTVPVTVTAVPKDGGAPRTMRGTVTLHRTAEIDGATPEQESWHIRSIDLKPAGAPKR